MIKVRSHEMLVLPNVTIKLSNMKKNYGTTECDKSTVRCDVSLLKVIMEPLNVREKKKKGTTKCNKRTIAYDVGTTQCDDRTNKCEKK